MNKHPEQQICCESSPPDIETVKNGDNNTACDKRKRILVIIFVVFCAVNLLFYIFSEDKAAFARDTQSYMQPAKDLLEQGKYISLYRLPAYPVLLAGLLSITADVRVLIIPLQIIMLFGIGLVSERIAKLFFQRGSLAVMLLVIFNPGAILHAHQILPDIMFSLLFVLYLYHLIRAYRSLSWFNCLWCGLAASALILTRGNGLYPVLLLPLFFISGRGFANGRINFVKSALRICFIWIIVLAVLAPWLVYRFDTTGRLCINSDEYISRVTHDNIVRIEHLAFGKAQTSAEADVLAGALTAAGISQQDWKAQTPQDNYNLVAANARELIGEYSVGTLLYAGCRGLGNFFFDPAYSDISRHLKWKSLRLNEGQLDSVDSVSLFLKELLFVSGLAVKLYLLMVIFIAALRTLAIAAVLWAAAKRNWEFLVVFAGFVGYFSLISALVAYARYRLPADPLLMILAVYGLCVSGDFFRKKFTVRAVQEK